MGTSKRYNLAPLKYNCMLFASTPPTFRPELSDGVIKIFPLPTTVAVATNFGTKLTITRSRERQLRTVFTYFRIFGVGLTDAVV